VGNRHGFVKLSALAASIVAALASAPDAGGGGARDDTEWLQTRLDAGGRVFLPKLPDGRCYATRGLWVSRDDTTIASDGACIVALGRGEARIKEGDGRPVAATAVFFLAHSDIRAPSPARVTITGLHITVPAAKRMDGIGVFGHNTTVDHVTIDGSPRRNVVVGAGAIGAGGMTGRVAVTDSVLSGGKRDVISVFGPVGLRIEGNTVISGGGTGIHIRAADRGQPVLDVRVSRNTVADNVGPGIFLDLAPKNGRALFAAGVELTGNEVVRNARAAKANVRGGIVVAGGPADGNGELVLRDNVFRGNRGRAILRRGAPTAAKPSTLRSSPPRTSAAQRDDTAWLQSRLDRAAGTIFLPKLPNGECYATRGLWVSRDDTTITSDGACIVSLGLGPVRLRSGDGDPIASSAVFFVNRSSRKKPAPVNVTISNLRIVVPAGQSMYGVAVNGHRITLAHLDIGGSPKDDISISGRGNGNGYAGSISILDSTLSGANRNAISATSVIGLRIEGNTIEGVRDVPPGQPAAGIDLEPDDRGQPALDVRIVRNTIRDNAGPGILLELEPNDGQAVVASQLEISGNTITGNSVKRSPPKRAGIVLAGGQDGGRGTLVLRDNVVRGNGGPGILGSRLTLVVQASGNDLSGNEAGPVSGF
jgi:hypothetical protein